MYTCFGSSWVFGEMLLDICVLAFVDVTLCLNDFKWVLAIEWEVHVLLS